MCLLVLLLVGVLVQSPFSRLTRSSAVSDWPPRAPDNKGTTHTRGVHASHQTKSERRAAADPRAAEEKCRRSRPARKILMAQMRGVFERRFAANRRDHEAGCKRYTKGK